jgi:hypothetical protein
MRTCPACGAEAPAAATSCPACQIVFAKYKPRGVADLDLDLQNQLNDATSLVVKQQAHRLEAMTGWEQENRYIVRNEEGRILYEAREKSPWWVRLPLGRLRPMDVFFDQLGSDLTVYTLHKPFRLWFELAEMRTRSGSLLGTIQAGFPIPMQWYTVRDHRGMTLYTISGAFWRPWTFKIHRRNEPVAEIKKVWGGMIREMATDADEFGVSFPKDVPVSHKALLMGALFLIDIVQFENNTSSSGRPLLGSSIEE